MVATIKQQTIKVQAARAGIKIGAIDLTRVIAKFFLILLLPLILILSVVADLLGITLTDG